MAIETRLRDGAGSSKVTTITTRGNLPPGQVVYTEPYRVGDVELKFMTNETYGIDINQDGTSSGTPEKIHNGTDSVEWTASALSGVWDFASTTYAKTGTKSVDAIATTSNNEAQFETGTPVDMSGYVALSGWIYVTGWSIGGTKEVELRARLAGVDVGNLIPLSMYINELDLGRWMKFTIPKADFGLAAQSIDQLVVKTIDVGNGAAPDYYLDDIQWEEAGGPIIFTLEPDAGTKFYIEKAVDFGVSNVSSILADASMQNVSYDKFCGATALTTGIVSTVTLDGVTSFAGVFSQNSDILQIPGIDLKSGGDGTNTWYQFTTTYSPPLILDGTRGDKLQYIISDDLSVLTQYRFVATGRTEKLIQGENK